MKISKTAFQGDGDEDGSPTRRFIQRFVVGILPKHSDFACFPLPLFYELFIYVGYFFNSITSFDSFSLSRVLAFGNYYTSTDGIDERAIKRGDERG